MKARHTFDETAQARIDLIHHGSGCHETKVSVR